MRSYALFAGVVMDRGAGADYAGAAVVDGAVLFLVLDVFMLLDAVEDGADGVSHFGSGEGARGARDDAAADGSAGGGDAFGLELVVGLFVVGFDPGFGLGVGHLGGGLGQKEAGG